MIACPKITKSDQKSEDEDRPGKNKPPEGGQCCEKSWTLVAEGYRRSAASLIAKSGIDDVVENRSKSVAEAKRTPVGITLREFSPLLVDFLRGEGALCERELIVNSAVPAVDVKRQSLENAD